jgi:hypothetical protein
MERFLPLVGGFSGTGVGCFCGTALEGAHGGHEATVFCVVFGCSGLGLIFGAIALSLWRLSASPKDARP